MAENSEPVVIYIKSVDCGFCTSLSKIWDTPTKDTDSVVGEIKKVHPKMRFVSVTIERGKYSVDENLYPKDLSRFIKWYPMILLVPGPVWNEAMSKLGPKSEVKLGSGVQVMNGQVENGELKNQPATKYNSRKPAEFGRWVKDSMNSLEFKQSQQKPILPLVSPSFKLPDNPHVPNPHPVKKNDKPDVCSMRVISRP